jgi:hypothetical protein
VLEKASLFLSAMEKEETKRTIDKVEPKKLGG